MKRKALLLITLLTVSMSVYAWKPIFVGHRGSLRGVQNTVEAYRNGADFYKYDGLECDVRVTKDGHYVIMHDETTGALCDQNLTIATSTLAELKALDLKQTRDNVAYTGKICTVNEYLDICVEKNCFPMIELKWTTGINNNDMSNFAGLYQLVVDHGLQDKAIFLTSMRSSLDHILKNYPGATVQYLVSSDDDTKLEWCKKNKVNPSFSAGAVTQTVFDRYYNAGLQVAIWTVNTEANYKKYGNIGCFMMTCDYLRPYDMPELEWDPTAPREPSPDALQIESRVVWERSAKADNLPTPFTSKKLSDYKNGQQAAVVDGKFYVNDNATKSILIYDETCEAPVIVPFSETGWGGSPAIGITSDDAGNIIQRFEGAVGNAPSKVRLFKYGTTIPVEVSFDLGEDGAQNNFINASGDVFSEEGGYLYFMPSAIYTVSVVHIANGELKEINKYHVGIKGSTASIISPINGPDHFVYMVRNQGFYYHKGTDMGSIITESSTVQPKRNSSLGGACFVLADHELLVHPSGTNYNGGFTVRDMTADNEVLVSFPELGSGGYDVNNSCGTFTKAVKVNDGCYHLYNWTMGNGYGVYEIALPGSGVDVAKIKEKATFTVFPNPVQSTTALCSSKPLGRVMIYAMDGRLAMATNLGVATTATVDMSRLSAGLYIAVSENGQRLRIAKK